MAMNLITLYKYSADYNHHSYSHLLFFYDQAMNLITLYVTAHVKTHLQGLRQNFEKQTLKDQKNVKCFNSREGCARAY